MKAPKVLKASQLPSYWDGNIAVFGVEDEDAVLRYNPVSKKWTGERLEWDPDTDEWVQSLELSESEAGAMAQKLGLVVAR